MTGKIKWLGGQTFFYNCQTQLCIRTSIKQCFQDRYSTVVTTTRMLFLKQKWRAQSNHWFRNHLQAQFTPFFQKKRLKGWKTGQERGRKHLFSAHAPHIKACLLGNCGCHCQEDWMQNGRRPITVAAKQTEKGPGVTQDLSQ